MFRGLLTRKKNLSGHFVIVSGLPRSGTSMMMKMLEAGGIPPLTDLVREADEDNPRGYYEFERVKKLRDGDVAWLPLAEGKSVKVIATLLPYLPPDQQFRVIFMDRSMAEILASQKKMLIRRGEDPNKISDDQLAALFDKHLRKVNQWLSDQTNIQKIYVSYNQLLENPGPIVVEVNRFLGGSLDVVQMIQVIDPDLYRQKFPNSSE